MNSYEINEETLALISDNDKTIVYEKDNSFIVNKTTNLIVEESCQYFGCTFDGRKKGTTLLTGITHKVPIIIEESKNMIFFPTSSPRLHNTDWISLNNLNRYYKNNDKQVIEFKNKTTIELNISYGILDNQILRATRLESVLRDRKKM